MTDRGPNLSHWPGNRTPARWKADLSTGICLRFARASAEEQAAFFAGASTVLNDHYDTDGFLSLLAVIRPEIALDREAVLLEAAATGDYQAFHGERGFAIDRIVLHLAAAGSPMAAAFTGLQGPEKDHARYSWLLDHAVEVLDDPTRFAALYTTELASVQAQLADPGIAVELAPELGLALIRSAGSVHRMVLNTRAGNCYRVLHTQETPAGNLFRYHDRTESWFEVQSFVPAPRLDLAPLRDELIALEAGGPGTGEWCLDPNTEPVPELYHGEPGSQAYGQISRTLTPSRLSPATVAARFADFFAARG